jgi:murein DD-endopeptidase MepM/ murein hydrolase activator NlpD
MSDDNALGLVSRINSELDKATAKADKLVRALSGGAGSGNSGGNVMANSLANISSMATAGIRQEAAMSIVNGVSSMVSGASAIMPDVSQTMQRAGTYYQGAVVGGGMMGTTRLANITSQYLGKGFSNSQSGAQTAAALAGQYMMPGTARFKDVVTAAGNATTYLNMDTATAASAFGGLTTGQMSANFMSKYGMFTGDPRTSKPYSQDQIFNQLKSRFIRQKMSTSETMDELNRGILGSNIRNSGMSQDQQFLFAQKLIEESKGKSFNYSDTNSMQSAISRNAASDIKNPFAPAQSLNATKDQAMQDAQANYIKAITDATKMLEGLTRAGGKLAQGPAGYTKSFTETLFVNNSGKGASDFLTGVGTTVLATYAAIKAPKIASKILGKLGIQSTASIAQEIVAKSAGKLTTAQMVKQVVKAGGGSIAKTEAKAAVEAAAAKAAKTPGTIKSSIQAAKAFKSSGATVSKGIFGVGAEGILKTGVKAVKGAGPAALIGGALGYTMGDTNPWDDWEAAAWGAGFGAIAGAGVFSVPGALIGAGVGYLGNAAGYYATQFADQTFNNGGLKSAVTGFFEGKGGSPSLLGMGASTDTTGGQALQRPVSSNNITAKYGQKGAVWGAGYHKGTDYACPVGSSVYAAASGKVSKSQKGSGDHSFGLYLVIDHGNGYETLYGHLSATIAKPGDVVAQGQLIAKSGQSGYVTGPHLHFEVFLHGVSVDPGSLKAGTMSEGKNNNSGKKKTNTPQKANTSSDILNIVMSGIGSAAPVVSTSLSGVTGNYQSSLQMVGQNMRGGQTAIYSPVVNATGMLASQSASGPTAQGGASNSIGLGKTSALAGGTESSGELTSVGPGTTRNSNKPNVSINVQLMGVSENEARKLAEMVKRHLEDDAHELSMARG